MKIVEYDGITYKINPKDYRHDQTFELFEHLKKNGHVDSVMVYYDVDGEFDLCYSKADLINKIIESQAYDMIVKTTEVDEG